MSWIKNLNIRAKLLIAILSFFALVVTGGFVYTYQILIDSQDERTYHYSERQLLEIENVQSIVDDNSKHLVALLSTEGLVREVLANPTDTTPALLDLISRLRTFKHISLDQSNIVLDIALYLPSGKRYYSTKSDFTNNADYSIAEKGSASPVSGYKMTFDGLEYVASYPIFSVYEQILGRVEVSFLAEQLVSKFSVLEGEDVAMLVRNKELLKYKINSSKSNKIAKYHVMARTSMDIDRAKIAAILPDVPIKESQIFLNQEFAWALKPMQDVTGANIGYFLFKKNREKEIDAINSKFWRLILIMSIFIISVSFLVRYIAIIMLTKPINLLKHNINEMALGHFPNIPKREVNDEITEIYLSIDALSKALQKASVFADDIRNLNFNTEYQKLSEEDTLGDSLIRMRNQLRESEEQKHRLAIEEKIKLWRTEAFAKLTEKIRSNISSLEDLSTEVTKVILDTIGASYGAFYIVDSDYLKPMALIAGDSSKQVKKRIKLGEGLVGEAAANNELAYIEDVPKDYIQISSGLGETKPKSLILLPLESHGDINGIIEIASIKSMEEYELEFLKLAASNISTGITEVLTNMETRQLLEQSQQQAEELSAQEEEMRQNLEELQTTQEEAYRREIELKGSLKAFQNALAFAEFDKEGKLTEMNGPMQDLLRINDALDFLGHDFVEIFGIKSNDFRQYKEIFTSLKSGILDLTLGSILSKDISNIGVVVSGVEDESGKIIKAKFIVQNEFKIEKGGNKALNDKIAELENELEKYQNISNKIEQTKKNLSR